MSSPNTSPRDHLTDDCSLSRLVVALRHVGFEDLGTFEDVLIERGFELRYIDACIDPLHPVDVLAPALFCVLGGPIGAYEEAIYPRVLAEIDLVKRRLDAKRPTLGICLGAQMMARALGARVYPGPVKEIGWKPLALTETGRTSPLAALGDDAPMLHWHGDTFDLPAGVRHLASTPEVPNQAFAADDFALALQFHPELRANLIERWLVGHACELAVNRIDINALRMDSGRYGESLAARGRTMFAA